MCRLKEAKQKENLPFTECGHAITDAPLRTRHVLLDDVLDCFQLLSRIWRGGNERALVSLA
jgi:hypothetical protein